MRAWEPDLQGPRGGKTPGKSLVDQAQAVKEVTAGRSVRPGHRRRPYQEEEEGIIREGPAQGPHGADKKLKMPGGPNHRPSPSNRLRRNVG